MPRNRELDRACINTIRTLAMDAVQAACLWQEFLRFDPQEPIWPNRDRFVLSAGHASMLLHAEGVRARVVSMPSWELFDDQPPEYRDRVLPPGVTARVSVGQISRFGWAKYVGATGPGVGMRSFGASAPLKDLQKKFGFGVANVVEAAREQLHQARRGAER